MKRDRREVTEKIIHNPKYPEGWLAIHKEHGRGPYYECQIGLWNRWRCPCGERYFFTDEQRDSDPEKYVL